MKTKNKQHFESIISANENDCFQLGESHSTNEWNLLHESQIYFMSNP